MKTAQNLSVYPSGSVFPMFSPLELEIRHLGLEIRILRGISSPEPVPKVWNRESKSENQELFPTVSVEVVRFSSVTRLPPPPPPPPQRPFSRARSTL